MPSTPLKQTWYFDLIDSIKLQEFLMFTLTIINDEKTDAVILGSEECHGSILKRSFAEHDKNVSDRYR